MSLRRLRGAIGGAVLATAMALTPGCGGAEPRLSSSARTRFDVPSYLLEMAASGSGWLQRPDQSPEQLQAQLRTVRGEERRRTLAGLAMAHVWAAEGEAEPRQARRHRRDAARFAHDAVGNSRDQSLIDAMAFVQLWIAWRSGGRQAERTAERFVDRHNTAGDLFLLGWIVRGEIALEAEQWDRAATAYRYLVGEMEHPLYAFALYRTAHCYRGDGRPEDARQALREVDGLGRQPGARPEVVRVADQARRELGLPPAPATGPAPAVSDAR